jgi:putative transposase
LKSRVKKTDIAFSVAAGGRFPMKAIAETLGVSRSQLACRVAGSPRRRGRYTKADDAWLLPMIRRIADGRASYGYRCLTVLLNRELQSQGNAPVNHKRVYRLMCQNGLLLAHHAGRGRQVNHDGKVITLCSNLLWHSDTFEIPCWNSEKVRVAFALDTCDPEAFRYVGTIAGISGEMIRDLMVEAVEDRFGATARPHAVEWLTDNGSCYTAHETVEQAYALGMIPRFTSIRSPESNGMAEAFVKPFKRDYVYLNNRPDARTVLALLHERFEDYNEAHPHKGLKMRSRREFIRSQSAIASCPVN